MEIKELGHIVLYVKDLERSVHFYRDVLGFRPVAQPDDRGRRFPVAVFSSGRPHHELLLIEVGPGAPHPGNGRRAGLYHFGFKIGDTDDELREAVARLTENSVPIVGTSDHTATHSLYILDPDGNEVELYIDVAGVDWNDPNAIMSPAKPLAL